MFPNDPKDLEYLRMRNMSATGMNNTLSVQQDFEQNDGTTDDIFEYLQRQQIAGQFQEAVVEMEAFSNSTSKPAAKEEASISAILNPTSEGGAAIPYNLQCEPVHSPQRSQDALEDGLQYSTGASSVTDDQDPMHTLAYKYADQPFSQSGLPNYHFPSMLAPLIYSPDGKPSATLFRKEKCENGEAGGVVIDFSSHHEDLELKLMAKDAEDSDSCSETTSYPSGPLSDYESDEDDEKIVFEGRREKESVKSLVDTSKIPSRSEALANTYKEVCISDPFEAEETSPDSYHAFLSLRGGGGDDDSAALGPDDDDDSEHLDSFGAGSAAEQAPSEDEDDDEEDDVIDLTSSSKPSQHEADPTSVFSQQRLAPKGVQPNGKEPRIDASRFAVFERESGASEWLRKLHAQKHKEERFKRAPKPKKRKFKKKPHKQNNADLSSRFNKPEDDEDDEDNFDYSLLRGGGDDQFALGPDDNDDSDHSSDEEGEVEIILRPKYRHPYVEDGEEESKVRGGSLRSDSRYVLLDQGEEDDTARLEAIKEDNAEVKATPFPSNEPSEKPEHSSKISSRSSPKPKSSQQQPNPQIPPFDPGQAPKQALHPSSLTTATTPRPSPGVRSPIASPTNHPSSSPSPET